MLVFLAGSAVAMFYTWTELNKANARIASSSRIAAARAVNHMVDMIDQRVIKLKAAEEIAAELSRGQLTYENVDQRIADALTDQHSEMAITVAWLPEFIPQSVKQAGLLASDAEVYFRAAYRHYGDLMYYDGQYTTSDLYETNKGNISVWFGEPIRNRKGTWFGSPYESPVSQVLWSCGYGVPFEINGKIAGVVAAELMASQANDIIHRAESAAFQELDLPADASFGLLIAADGTFLSHPDPSRIGHVKVSNLINELEGSEDIRQLPLAPGIESEEDGKKIHFRPDYRFESSGQNVTLYFSEITEAGWWVAVALDQEAIENSTVNTHLVRELTVWRAVATATLALALYLLATQVLKNTATRKWAMALGFAAICLMLTGWRLDYSIHQGQHEHEDELIVKNRAIANKEVMHYQSQHENDPLVVPTGVFIQSAEFSSANNVTVSGLVWQRHQIMVEDAASVTQDEGKEGQVGSNDVPGFVFPEADSMETKKRFSRREGDYQVDGWWFRAVLRQDFDFDRYPFDLETVWLRILPVGIDRQTLLIPDLVAYDTQIPGKTPGLSIEDFVLEGWDVENTFFSYRHKTYNADFGLRESKSDIAYPELYFNIGLSRQFLNAFIMNFITLSVVAFLLFAVLYTINPKNDASNELLGFNVSAVLGFCAALFFVVIISHTSLRQMLAAQRLVYLEYYFFAMYFAFLGVSVNAILAALPRPPAWVLQGENQLARLVYWPLLTATLTITTLVVFGRQ